MVANVCSTGYRRRMDADIRHQQESWARLEVYRERYDIETEAASVDSLKRSIDRRQMKAASLRRRFEELEHEIDGVRGELSAVEAEIAGSRKTGALLCDEIVDRARTDQGEVWSPLPILGFRIWRLGKEGLHGVKTRWPARVLTARCMNSVKGEDLPHSTRQCGPPACGIYATKRLDVLRRELGVADNDGYVFGVVALTEKVIEHLNGYRAAMATAVAVVAVGRGLRLATDRPETIDALFDDHVTTLTGFGMADRNRPSDPDTYLNEWKEREEAWTWDPR